MRTYVILASLIVASLFVVRPAEAAVWRDPYDLTKDYKAGNCTLVSTRAEANASRVYTLNPDFVVLTLNSSYRDYWDRDARCDELQFHVDHNTTRTRLRQWLGEVVTGWFKNIRATHLNGQTVSTGRGEWFLIENGVARRIPDWLTAMSHGLLLQDKKDVHFFLDAVFYANVRIGAPLQFSQGQHADKIVDIWKEGDRDYSSLPDRLADEISSIEEGGGFEDCRPEFFTRGYYGLVDWNWMYRNPGCPLA